MAQAEWTYPYREGLLGAGPFAVLKSREAAALAALLPGRTWDAVADLGCGTGLLSRELADRLAPAAGWILADRDPRLLGMAREALAAPGRPVVAAVADLDRLPLARALPARRVLLLASHVLYYCADWPDFVRSLYGGLLTHRSGGVLVVVLRSERSDSYVLRRIVRRMAGESAPRMLHGGEFARWLADARIPAARLRIGVSHRPRTSAIGAGLRAALDGSPELHAALTLSVPCRSLRIGRHDNIRTGTGDGQGRPPTAAGAEP